MEVQEKESEAGASRVSLDSRPGSEEEKMYKSGRWSDEEHNRFLAAIDEIEAKGTEVDKWRYITEAVGTRSTLQCRSHSQKYFQKLKRHEAKEMRQHYQAALWTPQPQGFYPYTWPQYAAAYQPPPAQLAPGQPFPPGLPRQNYHQAQMPYPNQVYQTQILPQGPVFQGPCQNYHHPAPVWPLYSPQQIDQAQMLAQSPPQA